MSSQPSLGAVRLQELKLWQGSYDNLLQKSKSQLLLEDNRLENGNDSVCLSEKGPNNGEWDKRKISSTKPFEEILEEKLADEKPPEISVQKVKRPFLRKGQGLARFRMGPCQLTNKLQKPVVRKTAAPPTSSENKPVLKKAAALNNPVYHQEVDLSPLLVPDFIRPRGTWRQVFESGDKEINTQIHSPHLENYEEFRLSLGSGHAEAPFKSSSEKRDEPHSEDVNENIKNTFNFRHLNARRKNGLFINEIPDNVSEVERAKFVQKPADLSLDVSRTEKELRAFEALEKKVDSGSFCSTNTSVLDLLASTPRKCEDKKQNKIIEEDLHESYDKENCNGFIDGALFPKFMPGSVLAKLQETTLGANVLQKFLMNLQNQDYSLESKAQNGSFSDQHTRWSSKSPSLADNCTEYETTCEDWKLVDVGVNTSLDYIISSQLDETVRDQSCKECEELRNKYEETRTRLTDARADNIQLKADLKELRSDYDKLKKAKRKDEQAFEEKLEKLEEELKCERRKIAKEKSYFENYMKEAQNRPTKKEREEISHLKQELADIKELQKLKDTKNGATQARLRTQVKQQEKEIAELKDNVEKMQRDNAKLTANQKLARRPREVKMLHEINRNLTKLTEKTLNKSTNRDVDGNELKEKSGKENVAIKHKIDKDNALRDSPKDNAPIEQQYENIFGNFASPRNVDCSTNVERTETTLPDGSIEIVYSNGNFKTVSADGAIVRMQYFNGDIKETNTKDKTIKYHYAIADSWHTQYPDGIEIMEYKDGQKCTKYPDTGKTEIEYPDGSFRIINPDGTEEQTYPDGRKTVKTLQGEQIILLPNGQKEIHTEEYKKREYPDGTVRILHKDGTVETVYANGRIRVKNADGILIMDTHQI